MFRGRVRFSGGLRLTSHEIFSIRLLDHQALTEFGSEYSDFTVVSRCGRDRCDYLSLGLYNGSKKCMCVHIRAGLSHLRAAPTSVLSIQPG